MRFQLSAISKGAGKEMGGLFFPITKESFVGYCDTGFTKFAHLQISCHHSLF